MTRVLHYFTDTDVSARRKRIERQEARFSLGNVTSHDPNAAVQFIFLRRFETIPKPLYATR